MIEKVKIFLERLRSLPEGMKKLISFVSIMVVGFVVIGSLNMSLSSKMQALTSPDANLAPQITVEERKDDTLSPAEGLAETVRSLGDLFPKQKPQNLPQENSSGIKNSLKNIWKEISNSL